VSAGLILRPSSRRSSGVGNGACRGLLSRRPDPHRVISADARTDPGFEARNVVTFVPELAGTDLYSDRHLRFYDDLQARPAKTPAAGEIRG